MEDLQGFIKEKRDSRELTRALAVKMTLEHYSHQTISSILQVTGGFISKWKKIYLRDGVAGLTLKYQGRRSYLTTAEQIEVNQWLQAQKHWQLLDLVAHLELNYQVRFRSNQSYYDLLKAAGLSWKKSQKSNPKKDAVAVSEKKKNLRRKSRLGNPSLKVAI